MAQARMIGVVAVVCACAALMATWADPNVGADLAALVFALSFVGALAMAALVLCPVVVVRLVRGVRLLQPSAGWWVMALVVGGLVALPVNADFYTDAWWAEVGTGVGACEGSIPLAEAVQNGASDVAYGRVSYYAGCDE